MSASDNTAKKRRIANLRQITPILLLLAMILVLSVFNDVFLSLNTLKSMLLQVSAIGVLAMGAMVVIITGGIDFTLGYGVAMIGMVGAFMYGMPGLRENIWVFFLFSAVAGLLLGLLNGVIISVLKVLPFIATLATMSICQGLSLAINNGATTVFKNELLSTLGQKYLFGVVPYSFFVLVFMAAVTHLLMTRTRFGVYAYAIGGNEDSARSMGIDIRLYKLLVYVFAGFCTAVGSILTVAKISMSTPGMSGSLLMDSIAATVIGGTSMAGGKGKVFNTLVGALVIIVISMALTYMQVQTEMQKVYQGLIIIVAVVIDAFFDKLEQKAH